ncbi:hypothetical protein EB796_018833 [Bugula neritina]|uniref:Uncharacterized protein n=1 Tax=Bugula neritina TaxID=10212 RepID=A0A7J7JB40_BUGNE|nr:hypothetical protein EB796_018833 [Bugula neritina]
MKPISLAYCLKHCLHMFSPYFLMIPCWLLQTRLVKEKSFNPNTLIPPYTLTKSSLDGCSYDLLFKKKNLSVTVSFLILASYSQSESYSKKSQHLRLRC